jgi:hypothetical protein
VEPVTRRVLVHQLCQARLRKRLHLGRPDVLEALCVACRLRFDRVLATGSTRIHFVVAR